MARVPYVTGDDLDPEFREHFDYAERETPHVWRAIGNNQEVMGELDDFVHAAWEHAGLTERERELVVLSVAATVGSVYVWHQHVRIGTEAGVEAAEFDAIARDDRSPFPSEEQALLAYARGVAGGYVEDPLHAAAAEHLDDSTLVGVATLAATYLGFCRILDALALELEDGEEFVGWSPE